MWAQAVCDYFAVLTWITIRNILAQADISKPRTRKRATSLCRRALISRPADPGLESIHRLKKRPAPQTFTIACLSAGHSKRLRAQRCRPTPLFQAKCKGSLAVLLVSMLVVLANLSSQMRSASSSQVRFRVRIQCRHLHPPAVCPTTYGCLEELVPLRGISPPMRA